MFSRWLQLRAVLRGIACLVAAMTVMGTCAIDSPLFPSEVLPISGEAEVEFEAVVAHRLRDERAATTPAPKPFPQTRGRTAVQEVGAAPVRPRPSGPKLFLVLCHFNC